MPAISVVGLRESRHCEQILRVQEPRHSKGIQRYVLDERTMKEGVANVTLPSSFRSPDSANTGIVGTFQAGRCPATRDDVELQGVTTEWVSEVPRSPSTGEAWASAGSRVYSQIEIPKA